MTTSDAPEAVARVARVAIVPYPAVTPSSTFFSYGFRPFFLLAGIHAAVTMAVWTSWLALSTTGFEPGPNAAWPGGQDPLYLWHAHEMLFGFIPAVMAGFFLTAVPGWTGSRPLQGGPLVAAPAITLAYILVSPAASIRVAGPAWLPQYDVESFLVSGIGWITAFTIYTAVYWPILIGARQTESH